MVEAKRKEGEMLCRKVRKGGAITISRPKYVVILVGASQTQHKSSLGSFMKMPAPKRDLRDLELAIYILISQQCIQQPFRETLACVILPPFIFFAFFPQQSSL